MVDKRVGPCVISVWADPNIGPSRFFVIVDAPPGGTIPTDLTVQLGLQPSNGRLPEVVYQMERDNLRGQVQFKTALSFDRREFWHVRVALLSAEGSGDSTVDVEATPVGLGRWDMLLYLSPFLMVGFLWLMAIARKRSRRKTASDNLVDGAKSASEDALHVGDTQK
ncbi:MAG: hypothetical protein ACREDR_09585 [Blastocatellia bacterium]